MKLFSRLAIVGTALLATVSVANADNTILAKYSAHTTVSNLNVTVGFAPVASVQFLKGVKRRILEVHATLIETTNVATALGIKAYANGIAMEPNTSAGYVTDSCTITTNNCAANGYFWLDIDTAELANPGLFVGVPVTIELRAAKSGGTTVTATGTIDAHMAKK